jgi:hypothetical protein
MLRSSQWQASVVCLPMRSLLGLLSDYLYLVQPDERSVQVCRSNHQVEQVLKQVQPYFWYSSLFFPFSVALTASAGRDRFLVADDRYFALFH